MLNEIVAKTSSPLISAGNQYQNEDTILRRNHHPKTHGYNKVSQALGACSSKVDSQVDPVIQLHLYLRGHCTQPKNKNKDYSLPMIQTKLQNKPNLHPTASNTGKFIHNKNNSNNKNTTAAISLSSPAGLFMLTIRKYDHLLHAFSNLHNGTHTLEQSTNRRFKTLACIIKSTQLESCTQKDIRFKPNFYRRKI